jgi:hypothetical protein
MCASMCVNLYFFRRFPEIIFAFELQITSFHTRVARNLKPLVSPANAPPCEDYVYIANWQGRRDQWNTKWGCTVVGRQD